MPRTRLTSGGRAKSALNVARVDSLETWACASPRGGSRTVANVSNANGTPTSPTIIKAARQPQR